MDKSKIVWLGIRTLDLSIPHFVSLTLSHQLYCFLSFQMFLKLSLSSLTLSLINCLFPFTTYHYLLNFARGSVLLFG